MKVEGRRIVAPIGPIGLPVAIRDATKKEMRTGRVAKPKKGKK